MRAAPRALRIGALSAAVCGAIALPAGPLRGESIPEREAIIARLSHFDTPPDLDVAALRERVLDMSRARSSEPVAPELADLPTFNLAIHFDPDTPVVRPDSYQALGRLADALVNASLLPFSFLIVSHSNTPGRREANLALSQRRADAIRDVLVKTFKISPMRLQSLGLGEAQPIDRDHPASPANLQIQIMTIARVSEQAKTVTAPPATASKKPAKKSATKN